MSTYTLALESRRLLTSSREANQEGDRRRRGEIAAVAAVLVTSIMFSGSCGNRGGGGSGGSNLTREQREAVQRGIDAGRAQDAVHRGQQPPVYQHWYQRPEKAVAGPLVALLAEDPNSVPSQLETPLAEPSPAPGPSPDPSELPQLPQSR